MEQQHRLAAEPYGQQATVPPEPIDAIKFVLGALENWSTTGGAQPLSVPAFATLFVLQLVRNPDAVKVYITTAIRSVTIEFDVEEADKGRILGKGGHTIDALRSLCKSVAGASGQDYLIYLLEDRGRVRD